MLTVHQPFQADLVEGVYPEAEPLGYDVLLSATAPTRPEQKAIEALLSHRCEALVLFGPSSGPRYLAELAQRAAVVVVGKRVPGAGVFPYT
jgi:DNA-binding LacI/PurR family transcriptional regulator